MSYTSEYNGQLDVIVAHVASVPNVGRVHDRPRAGSAEDHWTYEIAGINEIRAWEISPAGHSIIRREQGRRHRYRTWQIVGYVGLRDVTIIAEGGVENSPADTDPDASWHVINRLAGEIADVIDGDQRLSDTMIDHDPVEIPTPDVVVIGGGHLCWGITLTFTGYTIVT